MLSGDEAHTLRKEIVSALCRNYGSLPNNALLLALLPHTVGEGDGGGESYMTGIKYLRCKLQTSVYVCTLCTRVLGSILRV
jgi:hypothetical protein